MSLLASLFAFENSFDATQAIKWTSEHTEIPVYCVCLYLLVVVRGGDLIKRPLPIRGLWALWNLLLAIFSVCGAIRTVPYLYNIVRTKGFRYSICENPSNWFLQSTNNPVGMWSSFFIWSKIPELFDTVFLVLQKRKIIFLHWFHHCSVLLYCWHAFTHDTASGLWFIAMNYSVHSVMYLYYWLSISGYKKLSKPVAPFITVFQLAQMIVGTSVTFYTGYIDTYEPAGTCIVDTSNWKMGLGMYFSYFILFSILFYNLYLSEDGKHRLVSRKGKKTTEESTKLCGTKVLSNDGAGFFRSSSVTGLNNKDHAKTE